jgi:uncharacterized protein
MPVAVSLFLMMLLALVVLLAGAVVIMARTILRPPRMTDGKALYVLKRLTPLDLRLEYEPVTFVVRDAHRGGKLRLPAWWIPAEGAGRCMVIIHGYADAKVGAIAWAPLFHELEWNVLAIDLRAHGEAEGHYSTAGYFEREDVEQILNEVRAQRPEQTQQLALFGISLGAAVASAVAARRDDLAAVILECPFADFRNSIAAHSMMMGTPAGPLQPVAVKLAQWLSGADFTAVRPVDLIPKIRCPLMIIQSGDDPFVWPDDIVALEAASRARPQELTRYRRIEGAPHVLGYAMAPANYQQQIAAFLQTVQPVAPAATAPPARK